LAKFRDSEFMGPPNDCFKEMPPPPVKNDRQFPVNHNVTSHVTDRQARKQKYRLYVGANQKLVNQNI